MALFIIAIIVFIVADVIIRFGFKNFHENKARKQRESILNKSLEINFSNEVETLKRVEVEHPKAKILCVDDESVILDSFRKILVIEGYNVDTVENGNDALNLIKDHHYDFVFTDLKMPIMDGVELTQKVKHVRPDIDVIIITGFATVETAVECMQYGAMDYVQKPFTEDELLDFTKKCLIKRNHRIEKSLMPKVHITHLNMNENKHAGEFSIPGGVFIAKNHSWIAIEESGNVKIGIDDFAKKILGKIEDIDLPNLSLNIKKGDILFTIKLKNNRSLGFAAPISGVVTKINSGLIENLEKLEVTSYEQSWFCIIDPTDLQNEINNLSIGKAGVELFEHDIEVLSELVAEYTKNNISETEGTFHLGLLEDIKDSDWLSITEKIFKQGV